MNAIPGPITAREVADRFAVSANASPWGYNVAEAVAQMVDAAQADDQERFKELAASVMRDTPTLGGALTLMASLIAAHEKKMKP